MTPTTAAMPVSAADSDRLWVGQQHAVVGRVAVGRVRGR
jgi:hypothetical protein